MFNLGWGELVVIGIVALIAIGPKELPTVLRTLGQWMGKVRRMANEFQGQFQEALREAEFADLKKHADDISSSVAEFSNIDPIGDVQKDVERDLRGNAGARCAGRRAAAGRRSRTAGVLAGRADAAAGRSKCRRRSRRPPSRRRRLHPPRRRRLKRPGAAHEHEQDEANRGEQGALARSPDRVALAPDQGGARLRA